MIEQTLRWHIDALDMANAEIEEFRTKLENAEAKLQAVEAAVGAKGHELSLIHEDAKQFTTDSSTPTFQLVRNMSKAFSESEQRADALAVLVREAIGNRVTEGWYDRAKELLGGGNE